MKSLTCMAGDSVKTVSLIPECTFVVLLGIEPFIRNETLVHSRWEILKVFSVGANA